MNNLIDTRELAGTEMKFNLHINAQGLTMDEYDFECLFYPARNGVEKMSRNVVVKSDEMTRVDEFNYTVYLDTTALGAGDIMCQVTAHLPDDHCPDGFRTEIQKINTGIKLY